MRFDGKWILNEIAFPKNGIKCKYSVIEKIIPHFYQYQIGNYKWEYFEVNRQQRIQYNAVHPNDKGKNIRINQKNAEIRKKLFKFKNSNSHISTSNKLSNPYLDFLKS